MSTTIKTTANGSYQVSGDIKLIDSEGNEFATKAGEDVWLCRCGHSTNKPFCDGAHKTAGFNADDKAPATD